MKLSVVIPTHNRAETLRRALESLFRTRPSVEFEVVVVDNNSTDRTREVAESFGTCVRRVFEPRTAFSCARDRGATAAGGDVLVYCDDDVLFGDGTLDATAARFGASEDCGVMAGRILPEFEVAPPDWTLACQREFNGWSLYDETVDRRFGDRVVEVEWAAGPLMAIRKTVYERVGGFPPDTIGVETNRGGRTFNKLYVGPGDWGLCRLAVGAGWKVLYEPRAVVRHVIPAARMTVGFWRSRLIGEAYHQLCCDWAFEPMPLVAYVRRLLTFAGRLEGRIEAMRREFAGGTRTGMSPNEMWAWYFHSYLSMAEVFGAAPRLPELLWRIGKRGVSDSEYDAVMAQMPARFLDLTSSAYVYSDAEVSGVAEWERLADRRATAHRLRRWIGGVARPALSALVGRRPGLGQPAGLDLEAAG